MLMERQTRARLRTFSLEGWFMKEWSSLSPSVILKSWQRVGLISSSWTRTCFQIILRISRGIFRRREFILLVAGVGTAADARPRAMVFTMEVVVKNSE